ncbi:MAG: response regulator [Proteobacteria bacterium]|nr:MAG: response regulator [Pseudomonadota bacterium]
MSRTILQQSQILIIDDEKANVRFLEMILEDAGYSNIYCTTDSQQALQLFRDVHPDIVLLDLAMPHLDGFAVMRQLHYEMAARNVPILVLTADSTAAAKHRALDEGAQDFLTKPLDQIEVLLRINNLLENRFHSTLLEARVHERTLDLEKRTQELEKAQLETLQRLALAAEYRDDDTGLHTQRVGVMAANIAKALGFPELQVNLLSRAAPLHDVGKIGIADAILLKPGKLTLAEFVTMRTHTTIGANLLSGSSSAWLQMAEIVAMSHHERFDGEGYPHRLSGEDIPLVGRIVAVADVFDALTHERPYKEAWSVSAAIAEIEAQSGRQFDANVVSAFIALPHQGLL